MAFSVQMPALGESVTEGTVTRWLKQEGDRVEVDEPLLEVSTDKVDTEIPSPVSGILQRIVAGEDETVAVGAELAVIVDEAEIGGGGSDTQRDSAASTATVDEERPAPAATTADTAPSGGSDLGQPAPAAAQAGGGARTPVTMPQLGESVTEGTVVRWLKQVGDRVEVDEPLLEISTDKVDTEIPSPVAGVLLEINAGEDQVVEVGGQLAVIGDAAAAAAPPQAPSEPPPAPSAPTPPPQPSPPAERPAPDGSATMPPAPRPAPRRVAPAAPAVEESAPQPAPAEPKPATEPGQGAPYVTPLVRRLAAELGVDLSTVRGSGVGGRIRKQDVLAAAEAKRAAEKQRAASAAPTATPAAAAPASAAGAPQAAPAAPSDGPQPGTTAKMSRLRRVIATRMRESLQISAQLTTVQEVDITRIARLRARAKAEFEQREGVKLTYLPFIARATVETLKQFPLLNASLNEETQEVTYHASVHLGIAVDTPRGLVVPVIRNAEDLNVAGLAKRIADVAERTRTGRIGPDELAGGTFTITNIGSAGALFDTPIINQPQVAILGTGAIRKEPRVVTGPDGEDVIAIRSVCYLPLTYDHRLIDGADAGRFLSAVRARLEEGAFEADLGL